MSNARSTTVICLEKKKKKRKKKEFMYFRHTFKRSTTVNLYIKKDISKFFIVLRVDRVFSHLYPASGLSRN